jgi:flavodoxin
MLELVESFPEMKGKKTFLFSTSGLKENLLFNRANADFRRKLEDKGFQVLGEFDCRGFDIFGFLKLFCGISKGRPDERDIGRAEEFARFLRI